MPREVTALRNAAERSRSRERRTHTRARALTHTTHTYIVENGWGEEQNNARRVKERGEDGMKERIRLRAVA